MPNVAELLERESQTVDLAPGSFERLTRRRDRKERNRRIAAAVLAIALTLLSIAGLLRAFRSVERPATEPSPTPVDTGIFSGLGGWIVYGDANGIWAVDPTRPNDPNGRIRLSTHRGTPLAWSSDGSKLLIQSVEQRRSPLPLRLFFLNADRTETTLTTGRDWCDPAGSYCGSGGSISPDGSHVIYANGQPRSIFVVDTQGGTPRVLLAAGRRLFRYTARSHATWLSNPTYSPDGTRVAYFDHILDSGAQLRVMNADGSGVHVLLHRAGLPPSTGYHVYDLAWSPDGEHLAWGGSSGIFVVDADGSGLTLAIPGGAEPHWSPDSTRIAYRSGGPYGCIRCPAGTLEISALDGTHVQEFGDANPGPWNPLLQPEPAVTGVDPASGDLASPWALLLVLVALLTVVAAVLIRRRS